MNARNELGLPPAPPLPLEVRERVLRTVLDELDDPDEQDRMGVTGRGAGRRWSPLLTAAAVVLVAIAVAVAAGLTAARPDEVGPATGVPVAPSLTPRPVDDVPPTGDPVVDDALARCAAVAAGDTTQVPPYPPARTWRVTGSDPNTTLLETRLLINNWFACVTTPESATLSPSGGSYGEAGGVAVVRMTSTLLALYNPYASDLRITGGPLPELRYPGDRLVFLQLDVASVDGMRLTVGEGRRVGGEPLYDGPFPEPGPAVTVVDRPLPDPPAGPETTELTDCIVEYAGDFDVHPELWVPVGRHDVGLTVPPALIGRIGDLFAGFCVQDPAGGPTFAGGPLPAPGDRPEVVVRYRGGAAGVLLTVPADVSRMEIAPAPGPGDGAKACTIVDGLAACTYADDVSSGLEGRTVSVIAFTAADPQGVEVYRG